MPSLKAQEQGESEVATAALSRGNRFANSIRLCIATLCSPHKSKGNKYTYIGYPLPDFYLQNTYEFAVKSTLIRSLIARRLPCSTQDMLLHSPRLLKKR